MIIAFGAAIIVGLLWAYETYEAREAENAAAASAQVIADASTTAVLEQSSEATNIPAAGELPAQETALIAATTSPTTTLASVPALTASQAAQVGLTEASTYLGP